MYLKKLHISNFRCFRDYTIEFAPGVTVLFGKNGSGKSTLIHAIHKALSFAFKNDKMGKVKSHCLQAFLLSSLINIKRRKISLETKSLVSLFQI